MTRPPRSRPAFVLLGCQVMPLVGGAELAQVITQANPPAPVLLVSLRRWLVLTRTERRPVLQPMVAVPFDPAQVLEYLASLRQESEAA